MKTSISSIWYCACTLLILGLSSCTKEDAVGITFDPDKFPQRWELVKMTGSWTGSESYGKDMSWQEYYILQSDGTFIKHRERDDKITELGGTYEIVTISDGKYFNLAYEEESDIVGSCFSRSSESLWISSANVITSTWLACDGPGLEYKRTE